jgi:hypothetical protein
MGTESEARTGVLTMTLKPHADTSEASPGQSDRRERLIRIYDELDDAGKQELLRFAEELSRPR